MGSLFDGGWAFGSNDYSSGDFAVVEIVVDMQAVVERYFVVSV
jgi:hypothetical protein